MKEDKYVVYCDTDSMKLKEGYNPEVIKIYNDFVERKIKFVSRNLKISYNKFAPCDVKGNRHLLGVFENDATYDEFITQGAKKYAYKDKKGIHITVSGVPKKASKTLDSLNDFRDNLVFKHRDSDKNMLQYNDSQVPVELTDYQGYKFTVTDKSGCCILPDTYTLGKSLEYARLISDDSSKRAIYKEG